MEAEPITPQLSEADVLEIEARAELAQPWLHNANAQLKSAQDVPALTRDWRALQAENERLRDENEALNICELCDVRIDAGDGTFNVCGRCFNKHDAALREQVAEAKGGLLEVANYLDRHFTGREGRRMTWQEIIEHISSAVNESDDLQSQLAQVTSERDEARKLHADAEEDLASARIRIGELQSRENKNDLL